MRVRLVAFKDDSTMLGASKEQLRIEFNKNKGITDPSKIGPSTRRAANRRCDLTLHSIYEAKYPVFVWS